MPDERRYWYGSDPSVCQWCGNPVNGVFVDGATRRGWAILCVPCHAIHGYGLGMGRGQRYTLVLDTGRWLKDNPDERPATRPSDLQTRLFTS
jgi:hypothetical protein